MVAGGALLGVVLTVDESIGLDKRLGEPAPVCADEGWEENDGDEIDLEVDDSGAAYVGLVDLTPPLEDGGRVTGPVGRLVLSAGTVLLTTGISEGALGVFV